MLSATQTQLGQGEYRMDELSLSTLLRPLRKWWWLLMVCTLLAGISSLLYSRQQPPTYLSRTTLVVGTALQDPNPNSIEFGLASVLANSYADLLMRSNIQEATKTSLGLTRLPDYSAQMIPNTQMIELYVVDTDPQRAQIVANELVRQLIAQSPAGSEESDRLNFIDAQLTSLQTSIRETQQELDRARASLAELFSARQIQDMKTQIAALEAKMTSLQNNYAGLLASSQRGAINTIRVLEPATLPTVPIDSSAKKQTALAIMAGLALALAAAYALEMLDDTVRASHEVTQLFDLPVLATVPIQRLAPEARAASLQNSATANLWLEPYRALYLKLSQGMVDPPHTLLIASVSSKEAPAEVAAALGAVYAQAGKRVILVDADLRRPTLQHWWRLPNHTGLSNWLLTGGDLSKLLRPTLLPNLQVLTAGPLPADPAALLLSERLAELLTELRVQADLVITTCAPVITAIDASALATQTDGVVLVATAQLTTRSLGRRAVALLRQINARLYGVVFAGVSSHESEFSGEYGFRAAPGRHSGGKKQTSAPAPEAVERVVPAPAWK